jgi:hypothetical protein
MVGPSFLTVAVIQWTRPYCLSWQKRAMHLVSAKVDTVAAKFATIFGALRQRLGVRRFYDLPLDLQGTTPV